MEESQETVRVFSLICESCSKEVEILSDRFCLKCEKIIEETRGE